MELRVGRVARFEHRLDRIDHSEPTCVSWVQAKRELPNPFGRQLQYPAARVLVVVARNMFLAGLLCKAMQHGSPHFACAAHVGVAHTNMAHERTRDVAVNSPQCLERPLRQKER